MSREGRRLPGQLPLALPHRPATSRDDFIVGEANRAAIALIDRWPDWPERGVLLHGPAGSGKSHLVEVWRQAAAGEVVTATEVDFTTAEALPADGALAVEDLDRGPLDERALFHLLNAALERRVRLLVTSSHGPAEIPNRLKDLASRLRALHPVSITAPDDLLLQHVLVKLFADRQLVVDAGVIGYLAIRMERSLEAANRIVAWLDRQALAERRAITRQLAGAALTRAATGEDMPVIGDPIEGGRRRP